MKAGEHDVRGNRISGVSAPLHTAPHYPRGTGPVVFAWRASETGPDMDCGRGKSALTTPAVLTPCRY